ncbi:MAG TPA: glycosyltransferase family 2 protein [Candidatus Acidoferrum sp.]|nr:glycosyltransferase family 2 protein [Candidatus Acidoferrum sp.]
MSVLNVSIVIPTFNRAHLIERAVKSVISQMLPDDELIVVDDASTDNTEQIIEPYRGQLTYYKIPNLGAGGARNHGIRKSTRPLVAFLDSDDEWMPGKLYLQRTLMAALSDILFCFSNFAVTDNSGNEFHRFLFNWNRDERSWDEILNPGRPFSSIGALPDGYSDFNFYTGDMGLNEFQRAYILTSSLMVRREAAGDAFRFAEDVSTFEDFECFGRLSLKGTACYLDCETAWQHGHSGDRLTDIADLRRSSANLKILERVWGQDAAFRARYAELYQEVIDRARCDLIGDLLRCGQSARAREELGRLHDRPLAYTLASALPGPVASAAMKLRHRLKARRWPPQPVV